MVNLSDAIKSLFWLGLFIKMFADVAQICSPLVIKASKPLSSYLPL